MIGDQTYLEAFLLVFIGMGPLKALVAYLSATQGASDALQRKVARKMVVTALGVAVLIVLAGVVLMQVLHFSIGSLRIAGGIILLILAIRMVVGGGGHEASGDGGPVDEAALMRAAISPLAIPLLLNPIGVVSFTIFSVQVTEIVPFAILMAMITAVALADYAILAGAHRLDKVFTSARILVAETILGIFLAALSVQLIVDGLAELGIITLSGGH